MIRYRNISEICPHVPSKYWRISYVGEGHSRRRCRRKLFFFGEDIPFVLENILWPMEQIIMVREVLFEKITRYKARMKLDHVNEKITEVKHWANTIFIKQNYNIVYCRIYYCYYHQRWCYYYYYYYYQYYCHYYYYYYYFYYYYRYCPPFLQGNTNCRMLVQDFNVIR
jgi:hypothetical protein